MAETKSLGEKIRYFRKRAGLSQLQLELEIGASNGSISRIENGVINPTKETIRKIILRLKLDQKDTIYLLDLQSDTITESDIERVNKSIQDYLNQDATYAILLDNKWNIINFSKCLIDIFGINEEFANSFKNKNILDILFDPALGFANKIINKNDFYPYEIKMYQESMIDPEQSPVFIRYKDSDEFIKYWEESKKIKYTHFPKKARYIKFTVNDRRVELYCHFRNLNIDPRFELLDYIIVNDN